MSAEYILGKSFNCSKCDQQGANVEKLAMSGTGLSRFLEIQAHRFAFASCRNCGFTEVYNLKTLEGKDNVGQFLEILFAN